MDDRTFDHRTRDYKACVMLLLLCTSLTMAGYGSSHWGESGELWHYGLWKTCSVRQSPSAPHHHHQQQQQPQQQHHRLDDDDDHHQQQHRGSSGPSLVCGAYDGSSDAGLEDILRVPRILITLEVIVLIVSCVIAVVVNCRRHRVTPQNRYLEAAVGIAGLLGLTGTSLFWWHKVRLDATNLQVTMLSWSFHLVFLDSFILLGIACVISCNNYVIPENGYE